MCLQQVSDCDCIVQLVEVFDETDFTYMVMELLPGGYLIDKIIEKTKLNETAVKLHFFQIASAIQYLHSKVITSRVTTSSLDLLLLHWWCLTLCSVRIFVIVT